MDTMSVFDKIQEGHYEPKMDYPSQPKRPAILSKTAGDLTVAESRSLPQVKLDYEEERAAYEQAMREYQEHKAALKAQFRADLQAENDIPEDHSKADRLWEMAWDRGHSCGWTEVLNAYEELVELVN